MKSIKEIMESDSFKEEIKHGMDPLLNLVSEYVDPTTDPLHFDQIRNELEKNSSRHMKRIFHAMVLLSEKFGEVQL